MRPFIHDAFLLETETARDLYHRFARSLPIVDYHSHLDPLAIAEDRRFATVTELWLDGDHYKWRAMRANGVPEHLVTGDGGAWERFEAWAATVPYTLRNPLYHWTHMELAFPFGITDRLEPATARRIFDAANARLSEPAFSAQGLLAQYRVALVASTDDPADDLGPHLAHRAAGNGRTRLVPTWRPGAIFLVDEPTRFTAWLARLEEAAGVAVVSYDTLLEALDLRHQAFHAAGCRCSDCGLETLDAGPYTLADVRQSFARARSGSPVIGDDAATYCSAVLHELSRMDHRRGWVQQYHLGPVRNVNLRRYAELGPNTGFDTIGEAPLAAGIAAHLNRLDAKHELTKTILYNSNPRDNDLLATLAQCFPGDTPGKIQLGAAWWFLDQLDGMERHLEAVSNHGLLRRFVGMLTDSRSFLSFSRHDYFRRLFCNLLGRDVARGRLPDDRDLLGSLVTAVCFENARDYFGFELGNIETFGAGSER
ncbi:MAG: glucuronate isomerase [Polyangiaceae bacterium]|nr:glucuronate isomerase [Polyangiaceae bacterium]